jgi:hypothetical protein
VMRRVFGPAGMMKPSSLFTSPSSSRGVDIRGPWLRDRAFFQGPADLRDERAFMVGPTPQENTAFKKGPHPSLFHPPRIAHP